jgi:hypothetical protein
MHLTDTGLACSLLGLVSGCLRCRLVCWESEYNPLTGFMGADSYNSVVVTRPSQGLTVNGTRCYTYGDFPVSWTSLNQREH